MTEDNYKPGTITPVAEAADKSTFFIHTKDKPCRLQDCSVEEYLEFVGDLLGSPLEKIEGYIETVADKQSLLEIVLMNKIAESTSLFGKPSQWKTYRELLEKAKKKEGEKE